MNAMGRAAAVFAFGMGVGLLGTSAHAISPNACAAEQEAFVKASIDNAVSPESRTMSGMADFVAEREAAVRKFLASDESDSIPWHIKDTDNITNAKDAATVIELFRKQVRENEQMLETFKTNPPRDMSDTRFSRYSYAASAAKYRMKACLFEARREELLNGQDDSSESPELPSDAQCSTGKTASVNKEMNAIDDRLTAFTDSMQMRNPGESTPSLKVIMWATLEMIKIIDKYCPDSPNFVKRQDELKASYNAAMVACDKISSNSDQCVPAAP